MRELTFASDLAAGPEQVWIHATSMAGINEELGPWLTMRPPREWRHASMVDLPLDVKLGRFWILLLGVLPVDYDDLTITEHEPGRLFQERSSMLMARRWEHRRVVEPLGAGSRVTDVVAVEGRLASTELVAQVVACLFTHRHRRLAARFGEA